MNRSQQIEGFLRTKTIIGLTCIALCFISCHQTKTTKRDILFNEGWNISKNEVKSQSRTTLSKEFKIDKLSDKIYLLEFSSLGHLKLQLNNSYIQGKRVNDHIFLYNLTGQLKNQNNIEIQFYNDDINVEEGKTNLDIWLHCVNKLFIPEIQLEFNPMASRTKTLLVEVKIKNVFETEKQGLLVYNIYTGNNQMLETKETPVFISGKAENIYRHELNLDDKKLDNQEIRIECQLYYNDTLFDSNYEVLSIEEESLLTKID